MRNHSWTFGCNSLETNMGQHAQEMQQRLSVPQQQAVAAGFDEFVTSVRSARPRPVCSATLPDLPCGISCACHTHSYMLTITCWRELQCLT